MRLTQLFASSISLALTVSLVFAPYNEALAAEPEADAAEADPEAAGEGEGAEEGELDPEAAAAAAAEAEAEAEAQAAAEAEAAAEAAAIAEAEAKAAAEEKAAKEKEARDNIKELYPEPYFGRKHKATGRGMIISGSVIAGVGAAAVVTSALITTCPSQDIKFKCHFGPQKTLFIPMSIAVTALGAMLLGAGFGYKYRYKKWKRERAAAEAELNSGKKAAPKKTAGVIAPVLMQRGGGLVYATRF